MTDGPLSGYRVVELGVWVAGPAAAGLARYLLDTVPDAARAGVLIGYDARHGSEDFAWDTARVCAAAGAGRSVARACSAAASASQLAKAQVSSGSQAQ